MKFPLIRLLLVCTLLLPVFGCRTTPDTSVRIENITLLQKELIRYHDDGTYTKDFTSVTKRAEAYLRQRVHAAKPSEKLAIVFDIDETLLSNWPFLSEYMFGGSWRLFGEWQAKSACQPLSSVALYREAVDLGYTVFLISGRWENERQTTLINLRRAGILKYGRLFLRPESYKEKSIIPYKTACRRVITQDGYTIVMSMGDQWSDLQGGYAEKTYKLPNPFYYIY